MLLQYVYIYIYISKPTVRFGSVSFHPGMGSARFRFSRFRFVAGSVRSGSGSETVPVCSGSGSETVPVRRRFVDGSGSETVRGRLADGSQTVRRQFMDGSWTVHRRFTDGSQTVRGRFRA